jgi:hypothetical protein
MQGYMNNPLKKRAQLPDFVSPIQLVLAGFESPFNQKLNPTNRVEEPKRIELPKI